jgi:hypothetical protein
MLVLPVPTLFTHRAEWLHQGRAMLVMSIEGPLQEKVAHGRPEALGN